MSGVLHGVIASLKAAAAAATDAFFKYVTLLLNTTSTNGAQNNTFLDSSTNNFTITRNGDTTQGSFTPYMPDGYWGAYFDGTGDYLSAPDNAAFEFGSGDFTVECFLYPTAPGQSAYSVVYQKPSAGGYSAISLVFDPSTYALKVYASSNGTSWNVISAATLGTLAPNTWNHVAVTRSGTNIYAFLNGVVGSTSAVSTTSLVSTTNPVYVGSAAGSANTFYTGYISNLRVVKGTAVYTAAFTPPTTPLTAITNTSLLTCQSNRFKDNSSNAFAITRNGDTRISKLSPFNPPASWSAATYGGSGYFDGTGDYLASPANSALALGTGDFTLECWVYATSTPSDVGIYEGRSNGNAGTVDGFTLTAFSGSVIRIYSNAVLIASSGTSYVNVWCHVAVVRASGTWTLYINGVSQGTSTTSRDLTNNDALIGAGRYGTTGAATAYFPGYISNLRIVKGTAVYTSNFTPPTTPLTAIANTSLLCNFTNAGVYDASTINDGQTVGNAQVSTTAAKFGTTSMSFNGTTDYLLFPTRPEYTLGTGNFTIEGWLNVTGGASTYRPVVTWRTSSLATTEPDLYVWNTGVLVWYYNGAARITGTTNVTSAGWVHIAVVRNAGNTNLYVNGTQEGSTYVDTNNYPAANVTLKVGALPSVPQYYVGYIDELRITNGYARYGFFTPPTAALSPSNYTALLLNTSSTNGAQNNTFLDASTNNFTITRNGNTTQGSFTPYRTDGYWGAYFDGTGDYLTVPAGSAFAYGTGNFTVEAWVYITAGSVDQAIFTQTVTGTNYFVVYVNSSNVAAFIFATSGGGTTITASAVNLNAWNHIAVCRTGTGTNQLTVYVNGVGTSGTCAQDFTNTTYVPTIGRYTHSATLHFNGYISDLRVVKGTAVYTANFTPPTAPLTAITNTSLLTCQSNRFIDNSSNAFAITRNGDTRIQAFSPFTPPAYSTSSFGGSGYFDGTGDYLTAPDNAAFDFGSGDFTVEIWYYPQALPAETTVLSKWNAGGVAGTNQWLLYLAGATASAAISTDGTNAAFTATGPNVVLNQWNHIAFVRNGNSFTVYTNGVAGTSQTNSGSLYALDTEVLGIGYRRNSGTPVIAMQGYASQARIVKGTAVYTTAFTPPTTPLTAITNTSLLCNFTNGGIYDAASANDVETVGNAQVSTTVAKFGTTSMYFDGTGDLVVIPSDVTANLNTGDFTIEFWFNTNSTAVTGAALAKMNYAAPNWTGYAVFQVNQTIVFYHANAGAINNISTGNVITSTGTWYHVAVVKSGTATNNTKIYIDGVQQAQGTPTIGNVTRPLTVGGSSATYGWDTDRFINGYIQDLCITNGAALYNGNFTPPTAAFPTQ